MKTLKTRILPLSFALLSMPAWAAAATFYCDGQIGTLGMTNGPGRVYVAYGTVQIQMICAVDTPTNGTEVNTCKAWFALLSAAQAQQKTVRFHYDTANGNPASCAALQAWTPYSPYFLQTID